MKSGLLAFTMDVTITEPEWRATVLAMRRNRRRRDEELGDEYRASLVEFYEYRAMLVERYS